MSYISRDNKTNRSVFIDVRMALEETLDLTVQEVKKRRPKTPMEYIDIISSPYGVYWKKLWGNILRIRKGFYIKNEEKANCICGEQDCKTGIVGFKEQNGFMQNLGLYGHVFCAELSYFKILTEARLCNYLEENSLVFIFEGTHGDNKKNTCLTQEHYAESSYYEKDLQDFNLVHEDQEKHHKEKENFKMTTFNGFECRDPLTYSIRKVF